MTGESYGKWSNELFACYKKRNEYLPARRASEGWPRLRVGLVVFFKSRHHLLLDNLGNRGDGNPFLLAIIPMADGDGVILHRLTVDSDAIGRAGFVHAAVAAADRALVVVEDVVILLQGSVECVGLLRHAFLIHQRQDRG